MRIFHRLKTGLVLAKDSLQVLRNNPSLAVFPLVSGAAGIAFLAIFLGITYGLLAVALDGVALVVLFLAYLALTFVSSFFAAGLVHQTREAFAGEEPSLREGVEAAWEVRRPLLVWATISATVGILINALENSDSRAGRIVGTLFGTAWTLLTFFVIPVIVFEKAGVKGMFSDSASTFKRTWGETPISLLGVQLISMLVSIPLVVVGFLAFSLVPIVGVGIALIGVLLGFLVGQTLQGIVKTTLYVYATEGVRPDEFDNVDFDSLPQTDLREASVGGRGTAGRPR